MGAPQACSFGPGQCAAMRLARDDGPWCLTMSPTGARPTGALAIYLPATESGVWVSQSHRHLRSAVLAADCSKRLPSAPGHQGPAACRRPCACPGVPAKWGRCSARSRPRRAREHPRGSRRAIQHGARCPRPVSGPSRVSGVKAGYQEMRRAWPCCGCARRPEIRPPRVTRPRQPLAQPDDHLPSARVPLSRT